MRILIFCLAALFTLNIKAKEQLPLAAAVHTALTQSAIINRYSETSRNVYINQLLKPRPQPTVIPYSISAQTSQQTTPILPANSSLKDPAPNHASIIPKPAATSPITLGQRSGCIQNQQRIKESVARFPQIAQARQTIIKTEVFNVLSTLKQHNFVKSPNISINAKMIPHWHRLNNLKISNPEANKLWQKLVNEIQKTTIDPDGFYKPLEKENHHLRKLITDFENEMTDWINNKTSSYISTSSLGNSLQYECNLDTDAFVQHHAQRLSSLTPAEIAEFAQDLTNWEFLNTDTQPFDQQIQNKIANSTTYQKLCAVESACIKGNFQEAATIIPTIPQDFAQYAATETYKTHFFQRHTSEGIDKKLINHPHYLKSQDHLTPYFDKNGLIMVHPFNKELAASNALYKQALKEIGISKPSDVVKNLIYEKLLPLMADGAADNKQIQNAAVSVIGKNIKELNTLPQSQEITNTSQYQIINRIENAYKAMQKGNGHAANYLERALLSGTNQHILSIDHDKESDFFQEKGVARAYQLLQRHHDMNRLGQSWGCKELRAYELPENIVQLLKDHYLDIEDYGQLWGNELQHLIHGDLIKQLDAEDQLYKTLALKNPVFNRLTNLSVKITNNARDANAASDVKQAIILSDFNWKIINYVKEAGTFCYKLNKEVLYNAGKATLDTAQGLYNTVAHPITSFKNLVSGLVHLADTAISIVDIADAKLGEITYGTADKNQLQVLQDLGKQSKQLLSAVIDYGQKEGVPRLAGKAAYAATSVAWDMVITGKSMQLMNKFAKIAQSKEMGQFLQKAANALNKVPELEAGTAEGFKVAVPKGAEICALSEANDATKQAEKISSTNIILRHAPKLNLERYINKLAIYNEKFQKFNIEIYKDQIKHIANSHSPNGARFLHNLENKGIRASTFLENENFLDIALEALEHGTKNSSNLITYDCKRIIGLDRLGNPTSKITIALNDAKNRILTIFPV